MSYIADDIYMYISVSQHKHNVRNWFWIKLNWSFTGQPSRSDPAEARRVPPGRQRPLAAPQVGFLCEVCTLFLLVKMGENYSSSNHLNII